MNFEIQKEYPNILVLDLELEEINKQCILMKIRFEFENKIKYCMSLFDLEKR